MPTIADGDEINKKLQVKLNVVKRYEKELAHYQKEFDGQLNRIRKLEDASACSHDIKKQYEVLSETKNIIPDTQERLHAAKDDLEVFLKRHEENVDIFEASLLKDARGALN